MSYLERIIRFASKMEKMFIAGIAIILFFQPKFLFALEAEEIMILANKRVPESVKLAKYYMKKRDIPLKNLLILTITDKSHCSREEYQATVVSKIRKHIKESFSQGKIRCLLTMYGIPLVIDPPELGVDEKNKIKHLRRSREEIKKKLRERNGKSKDTVLAAELKSIGKQIRRISKKDQKASVDSELTLVLEDGYALESWIPNPYFIGFRNKKMGILKDKVLMVSRLDAPSPDIVKRMIDDSIETEKSGLKGKAYFDTRYKRPNDGVKIKRGYARFDKRLHNTADIVGKKKILPVIVNDEKGVFQEGDCPDAALYCGWYSLNKYVDAFDWQKGAVGYHVASSSLWHNMMLKDGVAATVGPVSEPYLQAFPIPEIFFGYLVDGNSALAECYMLSLPYLSWRMVLFGDPLYTPFKIQDK